MSRVIPSPNSFKGKRVAVLGGGFSAITTIRKLADEGVETVWLVRKSRAHLISAWKGTPCLKETL